MFQWDGEKAATNLAKHGVSFDVAREVFRDPFAFESLDNRQDYGEERFNIIGVASGRLIFVVYTMRGDEIRIISARGAEPYESRRYHDTDS